MNKKRQNWLELLFDPQFRLSDIPWSGRAIVEAYLAELGLSDDLTEAGSGMVGRVLEQTLKTHLEQSYPSILASRDLASQKRDEKIIRLLLVWAQYLEPAIQGDPKPRSRVKAVQFLNQDEPWTNFWPVCCLRAKAEHVVQPHWRSWLERGRARLKLSSAAPSLRQR